MRNVSNVSNVSNVRNVECEKCWLEGSESCIRKEMVAMKIAESSQSHRTM